MNRPTYYLPFENIKYSTHYKLKVVMLINAEKHFRTVCLVRDSQLAVPQTSNMNVSLKAYIKKN